MNDQIVLVFLCYKQEKYLRETLASAFGQTVTPYEILILDDASPDGSEPLIKEMIEAQGDWLRIKYLRNNDNVGLMEQLNSLSGRYKDKLIVLQAGDDVSKPHRLERVYEEWVNNGKPSLVLSNYDEIDDDGHVVRVFDKQSVKAQKPYSFDRLISRRASVFGCTAAVSSELLNTYPAIPKNVINEDRIYSFRALLEDGVYYIHEALLDYRVGVGISARVEDDYLSYLVREAKRELLDLDVNMRDAELKGRRDLVRKVSQRANVVRWVSLLDKPPTLVNSWRYLFKGVPLTVMLKYIKRVKKRLR